MRRNIYSVSEIEVVFSNLNNDNILEAILMLSSNVELLMMIEPSSRDNREKYARTLSQSKDMYAKILNFVKSGEFGLMDEVVTETNELVEAEMSAPDYIDMAIEVKAELIDENMQLLGLNDDFIGPMPLVAREHNGKMDDAAMERYYKNKQLKEDILSGRKGPEENEYQVILSEKAADVAEANDDKYAQLEFDLDAHEEIYHNKQVVDSLQEPVEPTALEIFMENEGQMSLDFDSASTPSNEEVKVYGKSVYNKKVQKAHIKALKFNAKYDEAMKIKLKKDLEERQEKAKQLDESPLAMIAGQISRQQDNFHKIMYEIQQFNRINSENIDEETDLESSGKEAVQNVINKYDVL